MSMMLRIAAVVGFTAIGCSGPSDEDLAAMELDPAFYETQEDPVGGGTNNHLLPTKFHANKYKLLYAMGYRLTTTAAGSRVLSSDIVNTGIFDTPEGDEVFTMAVECALAEGEYVSRSTGAWGFKHYYGQGMMATTAKWFSGPLTVSQKEDVFRCLLARLNKTGTPIDIVLTGQNVANKTGETHPVHLEPDALWDAKITTGNYGIPILNLYAWPLAKVGASVGGECVSVTTALSARMCDNSSASCNLTVNEDAVNDCYEVDNDPNSVGREYYLCDTAGRDGSLRPVVQSWVSSSLIGDLYVDCAETVEPALSWDPDLILPYPSP